MPNTSVLQFNNYSVEELYYISTPVENGQNEFQLNTNFNQELLDLGNNNYDVNLSVEILPIEGQAAPFKLRVSITGHFVYTDEQQSSSTDVKEQILRKNTVAILFPFLRQLVASLTNNANIATLMLPIMNFNDDPIKN